MKKTIIITILFSLLLTSCNDNEKKEPAVFVNNTKNSLPINEEVSTENNFQYGLASQRFINADNITSTEKELNNISYYSVCIDITEPFPSNFILKCFSESKTPVIIINYSENTTDMIRFANQAAKINIPAIYNVFPCYGDVESSKYKTDFSNFVSLIKRASPNSKIIWSFNALNNFSYSEYFPNKTQIDFIGLNCVFTSPYDSIEEIQNFKALCENSVPEKPVIITQFGVNHFDNYEHIYMIEGAEKFIKYFYNDLCPFVPNLSAVIYFDENMLDTQNKNIKPCDYSILSVPELNSAFAEITNKWQNSFFILL